MEKNDPKVKPQRRQSAVARGILALVLAGLLVVPVIVRAELKAVSRAWSWDDTTNGFECGHVAVEFDVAEDAKWVPLLQEVYFDGLFDREPEEWEPEICEDHDLTTQYAGWLEYGLASLDTDPVDAQGFQGSYEYWYLIDCDLNKDGTWDPVTDLAVSMPITPVLEAGWEAWGQDPLVTCSFDEPHPNCKMPVWDEKNEDVPPATDNHCKEELATQLVISLDTDCDGYVDDDDEPEYGDVWQGADPSQDVVYGSDGRYRPVNEMHRIPQAVSGGVGVDIAPADPAFGVDIEPADPTYGVDVEPADPTFGAVPLIEEYDKAYQGF